MTAYQLDLLRFGCALWVGVFGAIAVLAAIELVVQWWKRRG